MGQILSSDDEEPQLHVKSRPHEIRSVPMMHRHLKATMEAMEGQCDANGGYLYVDPKKTNTSFTFEQGAEGDKVLWQAEVTGGLRTTESYTRSLKKVLDIVTIQEDILPVGSFKYNVHKYPGDVDVFESLRICCCIDDAKRVATQHIQNIVKLIKANTEIYFGDFKAGEDHRFDINIGEWEDGQLYDYDVNQIRQELSQLHDDKVLPTDEFERLLDYLVESPDVDQWEELSSSLKEYRVLRWTAAEILQGFKLLPGGSKLSLGDALNQQTLVKIDVWARINEKYIEVTNFLMIELTDAKGRQIALLTQELPDYVESISKDVRFYSSPEHRKTLKAFKRLWSLALFKGDLALAEKISPLFSTSGSALNQINGEVEVLQFMLQKLDNPPLEDIMVQIDEFKPRIDQLNKIPGHNDHLFALVDEITSEYFDNPSAYQGEEHAIELLDQITKEIQLLVDQMISAEAKKLGLKSPAVYL